MRQLAPDRRRIDILLSFVLWLGVIVSYSEAIYCFRCTSHDDPKCDKDSASEPPVPVDECTKDPKNLVKDMIFANDLKKYGLSESINLDSALKAIDEKGMEAADLDKVAACAYVYASSENDVTKTVDKGVSKVKGAFGGSNKEGSTILRWIVRDCVVLTVQTDNKSKYDKCTPISTGGVFKFYICTCMEDHCNEGPGKSELLSSLQIAANVHDSSSPPTTFAQSSYTFASILGTILVGNFIMI